MSEPTVTCPRCGRSRSASEPRCPTCDGATDQDAPSKLVQWTLLGLFLAAIAAVVVKLFLDAQNS